MTRVPTWVRDLLDAGIPEGDLRRDPQSRNRLRTLSACLVALVGVAAASLAAFLWMGAFAAGPAVVISCAMGLVTLHWLRRGAPIDLMAHALIANLQLLLVYLQYVAGGITAPGQGWIVMPPLLAGLLLGFRSVLAYTTAALVQISAFAALHAFGVEIADQIPATTRAAFATQVQLTLLAAIAGVACAYIHARKTSERELRSEEARTRMVVERAVDGIVVIDRHGRIEVANPAICRMFGYSTEELIGSNVSMLAPSPTRERHDAHIGRYVRTGAGRIIGADREVMAVRKDGTEFPIELAVNDVRIDGELKFTGMVRDISDRRRVEQALRQSEATFRAMSDASPLGIFMTDATGSTVYANAVLLGIVGTTAGQAYDQDWAIVVHPEDRDRVRPELGGQRPESIDP